MSPFVEALKRVRSARKKLEQIEDSLTAHGFDGCANQLDRLDEVESNLESLRRLILGFRP